VEQAFNLGTVGCARAVAMEKEVGKLKEGMKADLLVFDRLSPAMLAAAEEDLIVAVALHSSLRYIDMVLVDEVIRKEGGRLVDVEVEAAPRGVGVKGVVEVGKKVGWRDVTEKALESRSASKEKTDTIDMKKVEEYVVV
jgi:Amidohydrolase family